MIQDNKECPVYSMYTLPEKGKKCLVMSAKILTYEGKDENGNTIWIEDKDYKEKFTGWIPL